MLLIQTKMHKLLLAALLASLAVTPAMAQFSDSYNFLKAVRDRKGEDAEKFLAAPGSVIINTRDNSTGETALQTLERELREELGVELDVHSARRLGEFEDDAVNEPGRRVRGEAYAVSVSGIPRASAEIAELRWIDPRGEADCHIAPLSARHILPAFLAGLD